MTARSACASSWTCPGSMAPTRSRTADSCLVWAASVASRETIPAMAAAFCSGAMSPFMTRRRDEASRRFPA
jgi:hypothetical protein